MRREILQGGNQKSTDRDQKKQIEQRRRQGAPAARTENRQQQDLDQAHREKLARLPDAGAFGEKPAKRRRNRRQCQPRRRLRRQRRQYLPPLPEKIGRDRQDQEAMVVGGRIDPDPNRRRRFAAKHHRERHQPDGKSGGGDKPAAPDGAAGILGGQGEGISSHAVGLARARD